MKKQNICTLAVLMFTLVGLNIAFGITDEQTFTVSADIPAATTINIDAFSVNVISENWTATGTSLDFDPMVYDQLLGIFLPDHFFAIEVTPDGAGFPQTTVTYTEGNNPNAGSANGLGGLGSKSVITFVKVTFNDDPTVNNGENIEDPITAHGGTGKMLLADVGGEVVPPAEIDGGWLRLYVGIVTGDDAADPPEPSDAEVFSAADRPGSYDGSLFISSTLP